MKKLFFLIVFIVGALNSQAQTTLIPVDALKEMMLCTTVDCVTPTFETYGYKFDRSEKKVSHYFKSTETEGALKGSVINFTYDKLNKIRQIQIDLYDKSIFDEYIQLIIDAGYHAVKGTNKLSFMYYANKDNKDKKYLLTSTIYTNKKEGNTYYILSISFDNMY